MALSIQATRQSSASAREIIISIKPTPDGFRLAEFLNTMEIVEIVTEEIGTIQAEPEEEEKVTDEEEDETNNAE